ncbi:EndoU domain-containing protein [Paenibacillus massiliensis]|uniref:EndoU domain-containing protein n=1 Tax=Paenibacillus massiliensis TaxID=225917 RepID=UPI000684E9F9|nr:EndoU domain-containing protein [Paenibacillus massiliensis]
MSEIPTNQSTTVEPSHIPLHRLELSAPFALQRISDMRMSRPLHDHARLFLTGIVDEEQQERVLEQARADQPLILTLRGEEGQPARTLFHGELQQVRMSMVRGVHTVELEAVSHTYQLDVRPRTRSFQDSKMTYAELIRQVLELYPDADCIQMVGDEVKLGELLVQYQETDWAFLQRMASRFGTVLVPEVTLPGPKLWFGVPEGRSVSLDNAHYRLRRSFDKDATAEFNHIIESETQAQPGDEVEWAGTNWTIGEITTSIQRELLLHEYRLMPEGSIHKPLRHNARLTGAILEGKVLEVKEDHLRVHLEVDEQQDPAKAWWFPYGTLYSAEGHSGWYVMPEVGDQIQVYFPNVREAEAVATASIRRAKSASAKLADPQVKVWGTAAGKSIELTPSELTLTASSGKVDIRLHSGGVQVSSDSSLSVSAKSRLSLHADGRVQVDAGSAIYLHAGGSSLVLDGETDLRSAQVKLEGTVKRPVFVADLEPIWEPPIAGAPTPGDSSNASGGEGGDSSSGGSSANSKGSEGGQAATAPTANLMGAQLNLLKLGQAVAGMIPVLGASPVAAAVGAVVAVAIAGAMPFMGHLSSGGARGRSSSSMFGQHLLSIVGGPLLGKAYTAARLFGRTPMAEELIKAMKDEMKRKQQYSTYMALHMERDMLRPSAPTPAYDFSQYSKKFVGSMWVLSKNGNVDQEAAKATLAYNEAIKRGEIKLEVPEDDSLEKFIIDQNKALLAGYNPYTGEPVSKAYAYSVVVSSGLSLVAGIAAIRPGKLNGPVKIPKHDFEKYKPKPKPKQPNKGGPGVNQPIDEFDDRLHYQGAADGRKAEGTGSNGSGGSVVEIKTIISPEMEQKILYGRRNNPTSKKPNGLVGGHSPNINNSHSDFAVEEIKINPDGTKDIKFYTQFPDGKLSNIKSSTTFPDTWTDADAINAVKKIGNTPSVGSRVDIEGVKTLHSGTVNGVKIDVIKIGDDVISAYPVGTKPTPGFN